MLHNHAQHHGQDKVANSHDIVEHGDEGFAKRTNKRWSMAQFSAMHAIYKKDHRRNFNNRFNSTPKSVIMCVKNCNNFCDSWDFSWICFLQQAVTVPEWNFLRKKIKMTSQK